MPVKSLQRTGNSFSSTFAGKSALLLGGNLVKLLVQITILIEYSRKLSLEDYGIYQSVWLMVNVFSVIMLFGLPSLLLSAGSESILAWIRRNKKTFFSAALIVHLLPVLYILKFDRTPGNLTMLLLYALLLSQNFAAIRETLAIKHDRQKRLFTVQVIFNILWLSTHLTILYFGYSLPLLIVILIVLVLLKAASLPWSYPPFFIARPPANTGKQWLFLGLFDVVGVLFKWVDKWMILVFISVSQFAVYFNGAYEIPVFPLLVSAAGSVMIVELARSREIREASPALFRKCMKYLAVPVLPSFFFLLLNHKDFFLFIFGEKYVEAVPVFLVAIFVIPVRICHFTAALQAMHRNDIVVKGAFLDLALALALLFVLYPLFGLPGVALAFVISTWLQAGYYLYQTARLLNKKISSFIPFRYLALGTLTSFLTAISGKLAAQSLSINLLLAGISICALTSGALAIYTRKRESFERDKPFK